ncbi:heteromeric transposase endonuclease subunit TnsA [Thiomonas sp. FB-Cd]|uniref:heteromeric transposase endonuclease subunit TnsA n=1 Tax=Thiomonas sp. FB-Cd TaxID=1158292 RepID=UPI0004DF6353|nr:heteromeric transposase endonuclease subunit TnsA [Thiomonas sp. FB-Cd]
MPVRRIPKNHVSVTGRHATSKSVGDADFESLLEADHLILLDFDHTVRSYEAQPVRIPVPAKRTSYVPDALTHFHPDASGVIRASELIEVKPKALLKKHRTEYEPKFEAARAFAAEHGWVFVLKTERDIRTPRLDNIKFLRRYRSMSAEPANVDWITRQIASTGGRSSEMQLLAADVVGIDERLRLLPTLWHLVITGRLLVNLDKPLADDSPISLPSRAP